MGAWGTGLYSGDFAADLRSAVAAVARLPFDGERLVEFLCETEPGAAREPNDPDHTVFWLVVVDQFAKRAIASATARDTALAIIDGGRDLISDHGQLRHGWRRPADARRRAGGAARAAGCTSAEQETSERAQEAAAVSAPDRRGDRLPHRSRRLHQPPFPLQEGPAAGAKTAGAPP
jgi:hypothetical protein